MKPALKKILIAVSWVAVIALVVTAVVFFIPRDNTSFSFECFQVKMAVSDFLKDLENQRYDDAFDSLYCVSAEDGSPVEANEICRKAWTDRVAALRNGSEGTYLLDHSKLTVRKTDGVFQVSVILSVQRQGYNDPFYANGNLITVVYDDGWKISSVSAEPSALQTPFEKTVSGAMTADERSGEAN